MDYSLPYSIKCGMVLGMKKPEAKLQGVDLSAMPDGEYKVHENRLRRMAERQGLILRKSKRRDPRAYDFCKYHLANEQGVIVVGGGFDMSLAEIERALLKD